MENLLMEEENVVAEEVEEATVAATEVVIEAAEEIEIKNTVELLFITLHNFL